MIDNPGHFQIVCDSDIDRFIARVEKLIRLGWVPVGGTSFYFSEWTMAMWRPYQERKP